MQNEYSPICIFQFSFFIFQSAKTPLPAVHDKFGTAHAGGVNHRMVL